MRSCGPLEECLLEWALFSAMLGAWGSICLMQPGLICSLPRNVSYALGVEVASQRDCTCGEILTM